MSMISEESGRQDAEKLERLLLETFKEEDRHTREKLHSYLVPLFKDAVARSEGGYSSADAARILGRINEDRECWG